MKNEPIIAYNHLQEEQDAAMGGHHESLRDEKAHKSWRFMMSPVALVVEIAAIITLLVLMIEEILH